MPEDGLDRGLGRRAECRVQLDIRRPRVLRLIAASCSGIKEVRKSSHDVSRFQPSPQRRDGSFSKGIVKGFPRQLDCGHGLLVLEDSGTSLMPRIEGRDGILMVVSEDGEQFIDNRWSVRSGPAFSMNSPR